MGNTTTLRLSFTAALIVLAVILSSIIYMFYDDSFAHNEFERLGIYPDIPDADIIDSEIRIYLTTGEEITTGFLNQKEIEHLRDVRNLAIIGKFSAAILLAGAALAVWSLSRKHKIHKLGTYIMYSALAFAAGAAILVATFRSSFYSFHRIFFSNDLWMMTREDNIIKLYPQQFFMDAFMAASIRAFLILAVVFFLFRYMRSR